ncbi:hypothetical protein L6164_005903 [Bauhinia variegata]|uniref:Uncharacterized protein n=1 Tax=Bauhinia variegata TaxID=167791 RepID=A0ACB9PST5_BAUVA|nr:hypothetical protein L6164_005903 [Bauhinia variegata]
MGVGGVKSRRFLFGALLSLCVIWFMFLAISANRHTRKTVTVPSSVVISKHLNLVGIERHHLNSGMTYVSKRRVPNGPDPIHNRYNILPQAICFCFFYVVVDRHTEKIVGD